MSPMLIMALAAAGSIVAGSLLGRRSATPVRLLSPIALLKTKGKIKLGRGPRMSKRQRFERALQAWAALSDAMVQKFGTYEPFLKSFERPRSSYKSGTYGRKNGPKSAGLFYDSADAIMGPVLPLSFRSRKMWKNDPDRAIAEARGLVAYALWVGSRWEKQTGKPLSLGGPHNPDLATLAEDYATDQAIGYLVNSIPGGGAILAVGQALGGEGWNYGIAQVKTIDAKKYGTDKRALSLTRAADMIAYARN